MVVDNIIFIYFIVKTNTLLLIIKKANTKKWTSSLQKKDWQFEQQNKMVNWHYNMLGR